MSTTVIGMFENAGNAQKVINDIVNTGFRHDAIDLLHGDDQAGGAIAAKLTGHGIERSEAALYGEAIRRGGALVALEAPDATAEEVQAIMHCHGARSLESLEAELKEDRPPAQGREDGRDTVPVIEEQVSIGKRKVLRGSTRLTTTMVERPIEETVRLREEKVEVDRQPVERLLSPEEAEEAFQQKTIEMTATGEEAEVRKEARVVEEISLHRTTQDHEKKVGTTVRRTDVKVEKVEPRNDFENRR